MTFFAHLRRYYFARQPQTVMGWVRASENQDLPALACLYRIPAL
jgi:hypothetical protein